jgi:pectinesterase
MITVGKTGDTDFRTIQAALNYAASGVSPVTIEVQPGLYREKLRWTGAGSLCINGAGGRNTDVRIAFENYEALNPGHDARALFTIKNDAARVHLENLTIENTHIKTGDAGDQAEALFFNSPGGRLTAKNARFISSQDTLQIKGFAWFYHCYVAGDVDFIWGYADTVLFEDCEIHARTDNRGPDKRSWVLQARVLAGKKGFVFLNCDFTAERGRGEATVYAARTNGKGSAASADGWDSIALIKCRMESAAYAGLLWDDDGKAVYPNPGTADSGWREYGNTPRRHPAAYRMTDAEYEAGYQNREQILAGTLLADTLNMSEK